MSDLLSKAPAPGGEIANDLNSHVINLCRVMQDDDLFKKLERKLEWTPYSKSEFELSKKPTRDPVERARRLVIRSFMGIELSGTAGTDSGFRMGNVSLSRLDKVGKRTFRNTARDWCNWKYELPAIKERLAGVMFYEMDAIKLIPQMSAPDCLQYIDPPYHKDTRSRMHGGARYEVEFDRYPELIDTVLNCRAMIVLSGYPHPSYRPLKKYGWKCFEKDYRANMSLERRTECIWVSPNVVRWLNR